MSTTGEDGYGYTFAATPATINKASTVDILGTCYLIALMVIALVEICNSYVLSLNQLSIMLWCAAAYGAFWYFVLLMYSFGIHEKFMDAKLVQVFLKRAPATASGVDVRFLDYKQYFKPIRDSAFTYMTFSVITAGVAQRMLTYWGQSQLVLLEQRSNQTLPSGLDFRCYAEWLVLQWIIVVWGLLQIDRFASAWNTYSDPPLTTDIPFNKIPYDLESASNASTEGSQGKKKKNKSRGMMNPYAKH